MRQKKVTATITSTVATVIVYNRAEQCEQETQIVLHKTFKSAEAMKACIAEAINAEGLILVDIIMIENKPTTYEMDINEFIARATIKEQ